MQEVDFEADWKKINADLEIEKAVREERRARERIRWQMLLAAAKIDTLVAQLKELHV